MSIFEEMCNEFGDRMRHGLCDGLRDGLSDALEDGLVEMVA